MTGDVCPACGSENSDVFFEAEGVPVHQHVLLRSREEALACRRADLVLGACRSCGFIWNLAFDPSLLTYSTSYENSQAHSGAFAGYLKTLAHHLVETYDLRRKDVIEIGCGKAEFLTLLSELGDNRGLGFDPSYVDGWSKSANVMVIRDFFSERYADRAADLVCARHVVEHVQRPDEFARTIRKTLERRRDAVAFIETPSVTWILEGGAFWDLFYEHCSYFSAGSLSRLFASNGFDVLRVDQRFGRQYLWFEARASHAPSGRLPAGIDTADDVVAAAREFGRGHERKLRDIRSQVLGRVGEGKRCVVWGAGAKGVTFLNVLKFGPDTIPVVADVNPRKQGGFIPGTGQSIVAPADLAQDPPDVVFVMNPYYRDEIRVTAAELGIDAEIVSL